MTCSHTALNYCKEGNAHDWLNDNQTTSQSIILVRCPRQFIKTLETQSDEEGELLWWARGGFIGPIMMGNLFVLWADPGCELLWWPSVSALP